MSHLSLTVKELLGMSNDLASSMLLRVAGFNLKFKDIYYPIEFICFIIRDDRIQKLMKVGLLLAEQPA